MRTRLFKSGSSQAVRIPNRPADDVKIERQGDSLVEGMAILDNVRSSAVAA